MNDLADRLPHSLVTSEHSASLALEFEARLAESSNLAFRIAYSVLRHRQDAEDVAQDAFVRAHREFHRLRDHDRFRAWLTRMAWRLALNFRRGRRRQRMRDERAAGSAIVPSHEGDAVAAEQSARLWRAVDALPERLRTVVMLTSVQELTMKEVAAILHMPEGTVKSRLFEAKQKLQEAFHVRRP
jgi:RNA polymerase sigma factor (sigma-70 family)